MGLIKPGGTTEEKYCMQEDSKQQVSNQRKPATFSATESHQDNLRPTHFTGTGFCCENTDVGRELIIPLFHNVPPNSHIRAKCYFRTEFCFVILFSCYKEVFVNCD